MLTDSERLVYFPKKIDIHELVDTITLLLHVYDPYTAAHSYRVAYWAEKLSRKFDRTELEHRCIHIGAHLHDIGKIAVSHEILNKNGKLTDEEYSVIKEHTLKGDMIVRNVENLKMTADIVLYHHERYDGRGYPDGLRGEAIPFDARIIAVVDSFDAMCSDRPYRKAMSQEEALEEIVAGAGVQFDPVIVEKFLELFGSSSLEDRHLCEY